MHIVVLQNQVAELETVAACQSALKVVAR